MDMDTDQHAGGRATPEQIPRKHIYVINGSADFLYVIRVLLQWEQYNVTTSNFIPRSFEAIEAAQPSLLMIDLIPREQVGWELLRSLQQSASTRNIPVILVSTTPRLLDEAREQQETFGGNHYLRKPLDLDDLVARIEELIGEA